MRALQAITYISFLLLFLFIVWMILCGGGGGCENAWWRAL